MQSKKTSKIFRCEYDDCQFHNGETCVPPSTTCALVHARNFNEMGVMFCQKSLVMLCYDKKPGDKEDNCVARDVTMNITSEEPSFKEK